MFHVVRNGIVQLNSLRWELLLQIIVSALASFESFLMLITLTLQTLLIIFRRSSSISIVCKRNTHIKSFVRIYNQQCPSFIGFSSRTI